MRQVDGSGTPLLMLHMSPLSGGMYTSMLGHYAGRRSALAPDRYGAGGSDIAPRQLSMEEYAEGVVDLLDACDIEKAAVLGTHTGAFEAVALARVAPERVASLALVAAPIFSDEERNIGRATIAAPRAEPAEDGSHLLKMWAKRFNFREPPFDLPLFQWRMVEEINAPGAPAAYEAVYSYPLKDMLPRVEQPLTVFAPKDDVIEKTERVHPYLPPQATYVDLPHLGLDLFYYATEEMAALVDEYLPA